MCGDVLDNAQIMCNEHVSQAQLVLQIHQKIEDLRLNGDVKSRNRLVTYNEFERKRARNADTLTASAVQFVRISAGQTFSQTDNLHQLGDAVKYFRARFEHFVDDQRLGDNFLDAHTGVDAGVGILEDNLHFAAKIAHFGLVIGHNVFAFIINLTAGRLVKAKHSAP